MTTEQGNDARTVHVHYQPAEKENVIQDCIADGFTTIHLWEENGHGFSNRGTVTIPKGQFRKIRAIRG